MSGRWHLPWIFLASLALLTASVAAALLVTGRPLVRPDAVRAISAGDQAASAADDGKVIVINTVCFTEGQSRACYVQ